MATNGSVEILLVEDNPDDVELTLHTFEHFNISNRIHVVRDGAEALDFIFRRGEYGGRDARDWAKGILLDIKLPRGDGLAGLRQIKGDPQSPMSPLGLLASFRGER